MLFVGMGNICRSPTAACKLHLIDCTRDRAVKTLSAGNGGFGQRPLSQGLEG